MRRLTISGPFSDADLAELMAVLRRIDERNPAGTFELVMDDPEGSVSEGLATLQGALPAREGRTTVLAVMKYIDGE